MTRIGLRDRLLPSQYAWQVYAGILAVTLLPALIVAGLGYRGFAGAERQAGERQLYSICRLLDLELASTYGSYQEILEEQDATADAPQEQAALLHSALQPVVNNVCSAFPGVEAGYYVRQLGIEAAAGPGFDAGRLFLTQPEAEFRLYQTGRPELSYSSSGVRVHGRGGTATQTFPVHRDGEIVGHVWARSYVPNLMIGTTASAWGLLGAAVASAAALIVGAWALMTECKRREVLTANAASAASQRAVEQSAATAQLAAGVVHEMRNPITVSRGVAQLILAAETDPRKRMWLLNIVRQMDHMGILASDFLKFARPREPKLVSAPLGEILGSVGAEGSAVADEARTALLVSYEGGDVNVWCDPDQLGQALLNLVKNAVEAASDEPDPKVSVRSKAGNSKVLIEVTDNGPRIPDEIMSRLFEPFFTTKPDGTGLGLAISKTLIESQGGSLRARNNPDGGVTFTVEMPRVGRVETAPFPVPAGAPSARQSS
ncbi:MAG: HAMP domain-containing sensor histidine kinase [Clostridia bacterium]|nr:HAMP domain-containing sensor histidine kinase [Clostridia bacterium]